MNLEKTLPFFSYIFHPLFVPVYTALYYFFGNEAYYTTPEKYYAFIQITIITILLPILFFFLLRFAKRVDSIMIVTISQRKIPLVIQCFLTLLLIQKSITLYHFHELYYFFLAGFISTVIALLLLFLNTKASLHMIAISAMTIFIIGLSIHNEARNIYIIAFLSMINGLVASSRLVMKAHTPKELCIGFATGVIPQLSLWPLWL